MIKGCLKRYWLGLNDCDIILLNTPLLGLINGYVSLKCDIYLFIKHVRSKIYPSVCRKYLAKELGTGSVFLLIRLWIILTALDFDMENVRIKSTKNVLKRHSSEVTFQMGSLGYRAMFFILFGSKGNGEYP